LKLSLTFDVERRLGDPQIKITIDDYMLLYDGVAQNSMEFDVPLDDGNHELKITHHSKTVHDHVLNTDGSIAIDKHVEITGICLDDAPLNNELWLGKFFPVYMHKADNEPYSISPNLYLGHNGTWVLEFATPALKWLIDIRRPGPQLANTIFKTNHQVLTEMKAIFENLPDV
jgi:hypothetical protein